jgi:hypothetical protein
MNVGKVCCGIGHDLLQTASQQDDVLDCEETDCSLLAR